MVIVSSFKTPDNPDAISVHDIYGNLLLQFNTLESVKLVRCSPTNEEPFIAVLTQHD